jgi:lipoate-protein ligase B
VALRVAESEHMTGLEAHRVPHRGQPAERYRFERAWFPSWRYDDALAFLDARWRLVCDGAPMMLATGVHDPAVITLGRHTPLAQILDESALRDLGATVVRTERGGGATAHSPGQIVLYPVVSLTELRLSVPDFTRVLGESVRRTLAFFGIDGTLDDDGVGVFVRKKKIASIGLRARRMVITHGLALNVENDLRFFDAIAPCGIAGRSMTSMRNEVEAHARSNIAWSIEVVQDRLACEVAALLMLG